MLKDTAAQVIVLDDHRPQEGPKAKRTQKSALDRVMAHTNSKVAPGACWCCRLSKNAGSGYPATTVKGKNYSVHQIVWMAKEGVTSIPKGKKVTHTCDNKECVNPDHLVLGDSRTNGADAVKNGKHRTKYLTPEIATAIWKARHRKKPVPIRELAAKYGCPTRAVQHIANGTRWVGVTAPLVASRKKSQQGGAKRR
jgi:hypothetical protein